LLVVALGGLWLCIWLGRWRWLGLAPIAAGYLTLLLVRPPDVIVAGDSREVAVRAADGRYLFSRAGRANFAEEVWVRRAAAEAGPSWPRSGSSSDGRLDCDAQGCLYRARGRVVAFIRDADALAGECRVADLVVSPVPARRFCRGRLVIDRIDTWKRGGMPSGSMPRVSPSRPWRIGAASGRGRCRRSRATGRRADHRAGRRARAQDLPDLDGGAHRRRRHLHKTGGEAQRDHRSAQRDAR